MLQLSAVAIVGYLITCIYHISIKLWEFYSANTRETAGTMLPFCCYIWQGHAQRYILGWGHTDNWQENWKWSLRVQRALLFWVRSSSLGQKDEHTPTSLGETQTNLFFPESMFQPSPGWSLTGLHSLPAALRALLAALSGVQHFYLFSSHSMCVLSAADTAL